MEGQRFSESGPIHGPQPDESMELGCAPKGLGDFVFSVALPNLPELKSEMRSFGSTGVKFNPVHNTLLGGTMDIFTPLKQKTTQSITASLVILSILAGMLSACNMNVVIPTPIGETRVELTRSKDGQETQELTLVSPTEVATEMPTITKTSELTPTVEIKEKPLTDLSGVRLPDQIIKLEIDSSGSHMLKAVGVISGYGTRELQDGYLQDYILMDIGKGKFEIVTGPELRLGFGLLDGTNMQQSTINYSVKYFSEILPYLGNKKGIFIVVMAGISGNNVCRFIDPARTSAVEDCKEALGDTVIGNTDMDYLQSVINGETITSEPVKLGLISTITISKKNK